MNEHSYARNILVADEDQNTREALVKMLRKENYQVFESTNELSVLSQLQQQKIHLVLMDLRMNLLKRDSLWNIRHQQSPPFELVLMTDQNGIEQAIESTTEKINGFLKIPFKRFDLLQVVLNALEHYQLQDQIQKLQKEFVQASHTRKTFFTKSSSVSSETHLQDKFKLIYSAFMHSSDAIVITDAEGKVLEINDAFTKLFGYTSEEIVGQTTRLIRSKSSPECLFREIWKSIQEKGEWRGEIINQTKEGQEIPIWLIITPIYDHEKKIGYMGIQIDLRAKKKLEERLMYMGRLAAIGQMSAQMAHEIRNPLSSMSLNIELLQEELESFSCANTQEARYLVASIASEIDRLSSVNDDYLAFARLPKFDPKLTQVNTVLEQLMDFIRVEASKNKIEIRLQLQALPQIKADESQLKQAFLNIIKNAMESMPQGGSLFIKTYLTEQNEIEIVFQDTGCGMTEETSKKFFDPFFTTKDKGTGLGMAITLQIIEEHQGEIECHSLLGKGTTFKINIPISANKRTLHHKCNGESVKLTGNGNEYA